MTDTQDEQSGLADSTSLGELSPGSQVGRFVVLERLSKGGMGILYVAYDPELDRKVALKLVRPARRQAKDGESQDARLLREAQALARLSHPNVVAVFDVGTIDEQVFLALEYIDGINLDTWIEREAPSLTTVLEIFAAAGHGLIAAHGAGILHRDIKPENIMVDSDMRVRLVDFGLARELKPLAETTVVASTEEALSEPEEPNRITSESSSGGVSISSSVTSPGMLVGTPSYMAPEVLFEGFAEERSDQYSFCISLYRAIYGQLPLEVRKVADLAKIGKGVFEFPAKVKGRHVPVHIRELLTRGLNADRSQRFPSMKDVVKTLEYDPSAARRRWMQGLAAGLVVLLLVVGGIHGLQQRRDRCQGTSSRLAEVWGVQRQSTLAQAFEELDNPFAKATWPMVEHGLNEYAALWQGAFTDACEATYIRREQSEEQFDLRQRCLGERLQQFDALIEVFTSVDDDIVKRASRAVAELSSVAACSRGDQLRSIAARQRPLSAAEAERVERARGELAQSYALRLAGRYPAARQIVEPLVLQVEAEALPSLEALVLETLAMIEKSEGNLVEARRHYIQAFASALAAHQDERAFEAASELTWVESTLQERIEAGFEWLQVAQAMIERLGDPPFLVARLLKEEGNLNFYSGQYSQAELRFREAIEKLEQSVDASGASPMAVKLVVGSTTMNLAVTLQVLGREKESLQFYDRTIEQLSGALGKAHPTVAEVRFNRASALSDLGRKDEARQELELSIAQLRTSLGEHHPRIGTPLNNLGVLVEAQGHVEEAMDLYQEALDLYQTAYPHGHLETARTMHNLAEGHLRLGDAEAARQLAIESAAMVQSVAGDDHPQVSGPLELLARIDLAEGFPQRVMEPMRRALDLTTSHELFDMRGLYLFRLAQAFWQSRVDRSKSLELATEALADLEEVGPPMADTAAEVRAWLSERRP